MIRLSKSFLFLFVSVIIFTSCKTTRKAEKPVVIKKNKQLIERTAEDLMRLISDSAFNAKWIHAKASVDATIGDDKNSFNISMRIKRDSAIWISISPALGIEVARVFITRDSVKFMDRLKHRYKLTDFKFLNDFLRINVDFEIIQGVLTGNLFAYKKNKFNSVYNEENKFYILSTLSKHKLKRSLEDKDPNKPVVQDVWLSDENFRILKLEIDDERIQKSLITEYSDFRTTTSGIFPYKSDTKIKAEDSVKINIEYNKVTIEEQQEFPFSIPASYKPID